MFTNSLFSDYLKENGLKIWKEESTRDIICLEFNYGSRSYDEEREHLHKIACRARTEYKIDFAILHAVPVLNTRLRNLITINSK